MGALMPKRSRVLHILKSYRPMFTGEGVFLERSSSLMQALAPTVEHDLLVTRTPRPHQAPAACPTVSNVFYLTARPMGALRHELALLWWFLRRVWRYQTIHVRTHADWYLITYVLAKLTGRRLIISATLDDSIPVLIGQYRARWRPLVRSVFGLFDGYIAISPKLHEENIRSVERSRCHLLPCGIDFPETDREIGGKDVRRRLGISDTALVLIFVGGLCARKDPLMLVRQLPAVLHHRPDTFLLLVGPPLEPDHIEAMDREIRAHGLQRHVIFVGEVRDPHPYFDAADIMTFASHMEGLGTVVIEAMAHALPVVVRHLPGVNDMFVDDGRTGFLFTDEAGYLAAVSRLARQPALRRETGLRARQNVRARFDMQQVARRYLQLYGFFPDTAPLVGPRITLGATASVVDRRFHAPAHADRLWPPRLLTIIDAEEAFDWNAPFARNNIDVRSMGDQEPAHRIFERFGVTPTYMVDFPVVSQDAGRAPLREWLQQGRCDIGAQLHSWVTPPFDEEVTPRNSYPGNLEAVLEFEKARRLTEEIESAFGYRPRIYRSGRYGAGPRTGDILKQLGYLADSSVMPNWNFSSQAGPDFSLISAHPYWIDSTCELLEIPGTAAIVGILSGLPHSVRQAAFSPCTERFRSMAARLRLLERIKLTPEGITVTEAKRLIRHMVAHGHRVFVVTYHTPSLVPGNTPYVRTRADLDRFLGWLEEIYSFFTGEIGGICTRWHQVRDELLALKASPTDPSQALTRPAHPSSHLS